MLKDEENNAGILYVIATPIGNLDDMTPRAISTLQQVDTILAEDTRHSGSLLKKFGITTPAIAYHDHNERRLAPQIIERLQSGQNLALISDAGTPLVSDPGYHLVQLARQTKIKVVPVPGACALITALSASGMASDRFCFNGFLPAKSSARIKRLQEIKTAKATQIFYEAPHRLVDCIRDMCQILGPDREACIARELTKVYETICSGDLTRLAHWLEQEPGQCRGEIVIIVAGNQNEPEPEQDDQRVLAILLEFLPPSQAVAAAVRLTGSKKNRLYQLAQQLLRNQGQPEKI